MQDPAPYLIKVRPPARPNRTSLIRRLLEHDLEYQLLSKNEESGIATYTTLWGIKRLLKKLLGIIPGFRRFETVVYFKYHKFRPRHTWMLIANRYLYRTFYISFQPGLGDMLQTYPYFRMVRKQFPGFRVVAVIHDPEKCRYRAMSYCRSSKIFVEGGLSVDYVKEFLETNPSIDEIIYDDCWGDGYLYGYPEVLARMFGFAFDKSHFNDEVGHLFTKNDREVGNRYTVLHQIVGCALVAVHFKTAVSHLESLVNLICSDPENDQDKITFLLLGAVPPAIEATIRNAGFRSANLSGSYGKGINTRQLIYIAGKASIFLGGRGGFNALFYLLDIPTINIFDLQGRQEMLSGLWPETLWQENAVGKLYWESDDPNDIYSESVKRFLQPKD